MEKKSGKMKKWAFRAGIFMILLLTGVIIFSPYGSHGKFPYKLVRRTVEIDAPVDSVYKFLSNSKNASRWSVFVDHITTLNADSFPDGTVGSRRRCFCRKDETGVQWDEKITELIPGKKRQLIIYNMKGFDMTAQHLATEQIYEKTPDNRCRLTLTVFFKDAKPTFLEKLKTYLAAYKINSIFAGNMSNIKRIVEEENNG